MKIITAIGTQELNNKIRNTGKYDIMSPDIQYQEAVLEVLEEQKDIRFILLNEKLEGKYEIKEFINLILNICPQIKIIIILEKENKELINFLFSKNINCIFFNNKITINKIIQILNEEEIKIKKEDFLVEEINKLKEAISKNREIEKYKQNKKTKDIIINKLIKIKKQIKSPPKEDILKRTKVISVAGARGSGKSFVCSFISNKLNKGKNKILILDFDILNNNLNSIYGVPKIPQKNKNKQSNKINNLIIKINKKTHILCATKFLFDENNKMDLQKFKYLLEELKEKYDYLIIDTSSECIFDYTKAVLEQSDKIIFLSEPNLLGVQKAKNLLRIYLFQWRIDKSKINIIFNKYSINSIHIKLLEKIFSEFIILGKLKLDRRCDLLINKNMKTSVKRYLFKKEYKNIINNLFKKEERICTING